jgi:hypothetical protein
LSDNEPPRTPIGNNRSVVYLLATSDQQHLSFTVHTKFNETSVADFCWPVKPTTGVPEMRKVILGCVAAAAMALVAASPAAAQRGGGGGGHMGGGGGAHFGGGGGGHFGGGGFGGGHFGSGIRGGGAFAAGPRTGGGNLGAFRGRGGHGGIHRGHFHGRGFGLGFGSYGYYPYDDDYYDPYAYADGDDCRLVRVRTVQNGRVVYRIVERCD